MANKKIEDLTAYTADFNKAQTLLELQQLELDPGLQSTKVTVAELRDELAGDGTAADDLVKVSVLDTRLGDSGNLGTAALVNTGTGATDVPTTAEADLRYLQGIDNLSDLDNAGTSRDNLGLGTAAVVNTGTGAGDVPTTTQADARYLQISNDLSELTAATARTNLGLGSAATLDTGLGVGELPTTAQADARYLLESNNLSDLVNVATARTNLGLGSVALVDDIDGGNSTTSF